VTHDHDGFPVKDREPKVTKRKGAMPLHGVALKRLLVERAATSQYKTRLRREANRSQWTDITNS
jgi:hypothetical protein